MQNCVELAQPPFIPVSEKRVSKLCCSSLCQQQTGYTAKRGSLFTGGVVKFSDRDMEAKPRSKIIQVTVTED